MSNIADSNNEPPPVPPTVIPSVVDTLDPDLAAAYRSGNPTIIQAVNSGMTTNAMIVNEVIRMGGGMTGLPPAIQAMVTERQKEMTEQADAENARLKALAAGVVGMGMMGSNIAKGGEYYGDGAPTTQRNYASSPPSSAEFAAMDSSQRMAYLSTVQGMSVQQWGDELTFEQRDQHLANANQAGGDEMDKGGKSLKAVLDQMENDGLSKAEIAKVQATLEAVNGGLPDSPEGRAALAKAREDLAKTSPHLVPYAEAYHAAVVQVYAGADARNNAYDGQKANETGEHGTSKDKFDKSVDKLKVATEVAQAAPVFLECRRAVPGSELDLENKKAGAAQASADGALVDIARAPVSGADAQRRDAALTENRLAGAKLDAVVAKAEAQTLTQADGYDEEPKVASAAPRLSINAQPLGAAGMLQPEGVVAANDPKPAPPEVERPRVATPSQGMSA